MTHAPPHNEVRTALWILANALPASLTVPCTCDRVIDGDTVVVTAHFDALAVDLALGSIHVRLVGVDAAERHTPDGDHATARMAELLGVPSKDPPTVWVRAALADKYGRALGTLTVGGVDVIATGLAEHWLRPYNGEGPRPWST